MNTVDAAKVIRSKLVSENVATEDQVFTGPVRPPSKHQGGPIPINSIYINDQGGPPGQPYLNNEGKQTTRYYDIFVRHKSVSEGRDWNHEIQSAIDQADYSPPVTAVFFVTPFVYSGRARDDHHMWRAPYKAVVQEYK